MENLNQSLLGMIEIERKFLVLAETYKQEAYATKHIVQGFLNTDPHRTVRIRIKEKQGFITVKGISNQTGVSRMEWEKEISLEDAQSLLSLCEKGVIEKVRYQVEHGLHTIEVDEFLGENEGLIMAEIELSSENEKYSKPSWLGQEVTGNSKYYNSQLSKNPFKNW